MEWLKETIISFSPLIISVIISLILVFIGRKKNKVLFDKIMKSLKIMLIIFIVSWSLGFVLWNIMLNTVTLIICLISILVAVVVMLIIMGMPFLIFACLVIALIKNSRSKVNE